MRLLQSPAPAWITVGPDQLAQVNPDLIYVSISGFGDSGPDADQMVYDFVIQARTGMAALQKGRKRPAGVDSGGDAVIEK